MLISETARDRITLLVITGLALLILLRTLVPTIYTLDSAEFVTGAYTLGIVHAPGYPLYLLVLHAFLNLPIGDIGMRGNLFSAICLALTVPLLFATLRELRIPRWAAFTASLVVFLSYHVWLMGLFTEVYAPQVLTVMLVIYAVTLMASRRRNTGIWPLVVGLLTGVAIATHPISALLLPGLIAAFILMRVPFRTMVASALLAVLIFAIPQAYLPIRYATNPAFNLAGHYAMDGTFQTVDLQTPSGLFWMLSGQQFDSLFFSEGVLPTSGQIQALVELFAGNFLGFGLALGLYGLLLMAVRRRGLGTVWLAAFVPFTYFYTTYGAMDKDMMFGPALILWGVPLAYGLWDVGRRAPGWTRLILVVGLPILMLAVNFPILDMSREDEIRVRAEAFLEAAPPDAHIFAHWADITPIQYLQVVEGRRPDLHIYNMFLFPLDNLFPYIAQLEAAGEPAWIVDPNAWIILPGCTLQRIDLPLPIYTRAEYKIYELEPRGTCAYDIQATAASP